MAFICEIRKAGSMTNEEALITALKETGRYGMFLGTFAGTFASVDELIAAIWGHKRYTLFFPFSFLTLSFKLTDQIQKLT